MDTLIYGLGQSGQSALRYLSRRNQALICYDTREDAARLVLADKFKAYPFYFGDFPKVLLDSIGTIVVSPGIDLREPLFLEARSRGINIIGDVELFARLNTRPVIAVTGSNGKSTVVSMVHWILSHLGVRSVLAGNIGVPVLDAMDEQADVYVLELSSFQLDSLSSLARHIACITNISHDHLDRYDDFEAYKRSKYRIFSNASCAALSKKQPEIYAYAKNLPDLQCVEYGDNQDERLTQNLKNLGFAGYELENALLACKLVELYGEDPLKASDMLRTFKALPHRCELIMEHAGIRWINDSKATNVGATIAAIQRFATHSKNLLCILGGDAKRQSFEPLVPYLAQFAKAVILTGQDAAYIQEFLPDGVPSYFEAQLRDCVQRAASIAALGDVVLLSPACSSLDQHQNYAHRGELFAKMVKTQMGL